jgi:hypothetical protein
MHNIPDEWKPRLREHLRERTGEERDRLWATDFGGTHVQLRFPDGSHAFFRYAFYLLDRERGEAAVFTEHCGYHYFPLAELELELLRNEWTDIGTAD